MKVRNQMLLFFTLLLISCSLEAQEKINDVKAPSSPASSILGLQPNAILNPKSFQALEASIFSNFLNQNQDIQIPNNFALEFTPYWFKNHGLTLNDYLFPKTPYKQIQRTASFSVASTQNYILQDSSKTNGLALGYRSTFYISGNKDQRQIEDLIKKQRDKQRILTNIQAKTSFIITNQEPSSFEYSKFLSQLESDLAESTLEEADKNIYKAFVKILGKQVLTSQVLSGTPDTIMAIFNKFYDAKFKTKSLHQEIKNYIKNRYGLSVDLAYALFINFPSNNFEYSIVPRQSIWVTPNFRFHGKFDFLKVLGVFRYEWYDVSYFQRYFPKSDSYKNNFDFGLAIGAEFDKLSIQIEAVKRQKRSLIESGVDTNGEALYKLRRDSDFQYIASLNYKLTGQIALSYSLGKNFESIQNTNNRIVSQLALNFGFGTPVTPK